MKFIKIIKYLTFSIFLSLVFFNQTQASVLETISGSFSSNNGDSAHNLKELEQKLDISLPKLYNKGYNPTVSSVELSIKNQSGNFLTTYKAIIEESTDGKAWVGFTARGSFGNLASVNCPADPSKQNYQIRAEGQITGCENSDGKSLEEKLKTTSTISAGDVRIINVYDDPTVLVREYFINFTKPKTFPPHENQNQTGDTGTGNNQTQTYNPQNQNTNTDKIKEGDGTCNDGKDNSVPSDGKADYYGVDTNRDGILDLEPDPSCIAPGGTEKADLSAGNLLSCYNFCTFSDLLKTINNLITFLITKLFIPVVVFLFIYAGFKYITAQGDPKKIVDLKKIVFNILIGMLLVLCSWLIVKVVLTILVKDDDSALQFLE